MDFIKIKNFYALKDLIKKAKRQPTEWGKIFANHIPDKAATSRICKKIPIIQQQQKTT